MVRRLCKAASPGASASKKTIETDSLLKSSCHHSHFCQIRPASFFCAHRVCRRIVTLRQLFDDSLTTKTTLHNTRTSWRSDGPPCLGGSSHGWVPVDPHSTSHAPSREEAVGGSQHCNPQENNFSSVERTFCDCGLSTTSTTPILSVLRSSFISAVCNAFGSSVNVAVSFPL